MIRLTSAGFLLALLVTVAPLSAHENYRVIGTITKVTAEKLDVKQTKDGKIISMFMDGKTRVTRDKKKAPLAAVKAGASVVVDAHGDTLDDLDVVEIRLVPHPAKK